MLLAFCANGLRRKPRQAVDGTEGVLEQLVNVVARPRHFPKKFVHVLPVVDLEKLGLVHEEHPKRNPEHHLVSFVQDAVPDANCRRRWHSVQEERQHPVEREHGKVNLEAFKVGVQLVEPLLQDLAQHPLVHLCPFHLAGVVPVREDEFDHANEHPEGRLFRQKQQPESREHVESLAVPEIRVVPAVHREDASERVNLVGRVVVKVTVRRKGAAEIELDLPCGGGLDSGPRFAQPMIVPGTDVGLQSLRPHLDRHSPHFATELVRDPLSDQVFGLARVFGGRHDLAIARLEESLPLSQRPLLGDGILLP
mmetsp:Transcript_15784/g.40822  ORF Transcript_15784/g.40822 Transcript_15784/m.40822 type:complete len:309 (+) Transcript_15784:424-1350(+)